ncbi:hepatitis A virus cellular receptor 1 homolog [Cololabis saira]|uniref:hepatitis A virus cellular receptor 1 homolog n=1 Tax=Cololabis saira TaxID=129043 RepID=UPI002AD25E1E|nr:hepatitis A virus cellular receptor 1 homolog [Cololabis saira]
MLLLLNIVGSISLLSGQVRVSAVATETVVGVAGRAVKLPCRSEAAKQGKVEVCWGRGQPSIFTCHNTVINSARDHVTYQKSDRYSVSSSSSLSILDSQLSDAGFYHCRVQLPGPFNDESFIVHLIIISHNQDVENVNTPRATTGYNTATTGSDVREGDGTEPIMAHVQSRDQQEDVHDTLQMFVGNALRLSFIVFIPALLLTAAYRVWRSKWRSETNRMPDQSEFEEDSSV